MLEGGLQVLFKGPEPNAKLSTWSIDNREKVPSSPVDVQQGGPLSRVLRGLGKFDSSPKGQSMIEYLGLIVLAMFGCALVGELMNLTGLVQQLATSTPNATRALAIATKIATVTPEATRVLASATPMLHHALATATGIATATPQVLAKATEATNSGGTTGGALGAIVFIFLLALAMAGPLSPGSQGTSDPKSK